MQLLSLLCLLQPPVLGREGAEQVQGAVAVLGRVGCAQQGKEHPALLGEQSVAVVPDALGSRDGSLLQGAQLDPV